jgi:asparagine synthase (glutamine-hydrolysing)
MTAVAGLWCLDGRPDAAEYCARMLASQDLYGRHGGAQWSNGDVALGRRLMRVLPEDAHDRQPLLSHRGDYVLVADVRLDNRTEVAQALQIPLSEAGNLCDAALLLAAIERWGESCLGRIIGDYAFVLWDGARRRLLLARDPLGQRPLHYHRNNRFFAFASMPKGLHALAEVPSAPNEDHIASFLMLMPETGPETFFLGIERVEPGQIVIVTPSGVTTRRHWQPSRRQVAFRRPEEYSEALRELLDQAVRCRLRGTENVGSCLSGGLDSAAVAATAARLLAPSGRRVIAFTAVPRNGYDGPAPRNRFVDEGPHAAATAALYSNMEHVLIRSEGRSPLDDLDRSFFLFDRPTLNICNIGWCNSICDAAQKRNLSVLLSGDLGNIGLSYDGLELLPELFSRGRLLRLWREARALVGSGGPGRMRWRGVLARTLGPWCPAPVWVWLNRTMNGSTSEIINYSAINLCRLAELKLPARARELGVDLVGRPWKDGFAKRVLALRGVDLGNYNKGTLGGWQIDLRDPTSDVRLVEFCLSVPTEQFLSKGQQRALARRALSDRLPGLVVEETRKGLQAADWHERLTIVRDRVAAELNRLDACPQAAKALDLDRLHRLVENWPTEGWEHREVSIPYRAALLRGISTGHFVRRSMGANV